VPSLVRKFVVLGAVAGSLLFARQSLADLVTFESPHRARVAAATLDDDFARSVDKRLDEAEVTSVDALVRLSLDIAGADLRFGLDHATTLRFGSKEREGNCVEYAHLFATVFNRGAVKKRLVARAYVVRSDARVLGQRLSSPAFVDHDWVLIVPNVAGAKRSFVDPTFYDLGLGWDITRSIAGDVRTPS
jgi:hypothetical protein